MQRYYHDKIRLLAMFVIREKRGATEWVKNWFLRGRNSLGEFVSHDPAVAGRVDLCLKKETGPPRWSRGDKRPCIATCCIHPGNRRNFFIHETRTSASPTGGLTNRWQLTELERLTRSENARRKFSSFLDISIFRHWSLAFSPYCQIWKRAVLINSWNWYVSFEICSFWIFQVKQ